MTGAEPTAEEGGKPHDALTAAAAAEFDVDRGAQTRPAWPSRIAIPPPSDMTDDAPPITQRGDAVIIQGERALALLYRACFALTLRNHRDGVAPPPLLHELARHLHRATMSARGHKDAPSPTSREAGSDGQYGDDLIGSAEVAALLGVATGGQARRLVAADPLLGVRRGSIWLAETVSRAGDGRKASTTMTAPTEYPSNWPGARPSARKFHRQRLVRQKRA